ncbi:MAG TPA: MEDS domain-containing protein [Telluria sp.]|nr:MEDS domain-containing protein [Telluria sp.]
MKQILPKQEAANVFWSELAPCDHCVQIYENDAAFLEALEGFVAGGIRQGDAIILIGTPAHLASLRMRLLRNGFDVDAAMARDQYIALDARETMETFMVNGWPDEALFEQAVDAVLVRARAQHRKVRAFGEMVALMWADGQCGAAIHLEHLWGRLVNREAFSLFCAYPSAGFAHDPRESVEQVCASHTKVYSL